MVGEDYTKEIIQHEFGHILQYKQRGFWKFYWEVGSPSLINMILLKLEFIFLGVNRQVPKHASLKVEIEADQMAKQYFLSHIY